MRIISGTHKGKSIVAPKNLPVRPTTDFAKEALFNILENNFYMDDIHVLDLFSGTGNISYEFASRGVRSVTSIDQNYGCIKFIKKTISELNYTTVQVIKNDVFKFLKQSSQTYDIIFADPPYDLNNISEIVTLVMENNLLSDNGWLIIEHDKRTDLSTYLSFIQLRKYGNVNFSFFQVQST